MAAYTGRPIDESGVAPQKRKHKEYERLLAKLQNELTSSEFIDSACEHEAGHLIFFKRAGFTQFEFLGPTMIYNERKRDVSEEQRYDYCPAAVRTLDASDIKHYNNNLLDMIARGAVAGWVFNEVRDNITPRPTDKDSDFDSFDEHCRRALQKDLSFGYDAKGRWCRARKFVKAYLEDRTNELEIQATAIEVKRRCFRLR